MSGRDRVFVDANELLPCSVMDLVLALAEDLLIDFVGTDELLDEWERVIVREGQRTAETARSVSVSVSEAVRWFVVTTRIDDRVHTAACAFGGASVLLTRNQRDFPAEFLAGHGVTVTPADDYLTTPASQPYRPVTSLRASAGVVRYVSRPASGVGSAVPNS